MKYWETITDNLIRNAQKFFTELKRRKIFIVAIAYVVIAWLLMQIASQILPKFEIPNWAMRFVVLLLVIGFPVAVMLAWRFELTTKGIKRRENVNLSKVFTGPKPRSQPDHKGFISSKDDTNNGAKITEIDISKQARALAWLRLSDYTLVVLCGLWAIDLLSQLVVNFQSTSAGALVLELIALLIVCFAAYTGWRHVGVIDPGVWKAYRVVFPLLVVLILILLVYASVVLATFGSTRSDLMTTQTLNMLLTSVWIGGTAVLGWISLLLLQRTNITAMGATVGHVLLQLVQNAGVRAERATYIRRISRTRGLVNGAAGALLLLACAAGPLLKDKELADILAGGFGLGSALTLLGFFLLVRARRYFQIDADSLLAVDRRPPILFLRSFDDDEKHTYSSAQKALLDFSLEIRLSNHFSRFGPFVAIGSPKETVPQPGAARVLLSDDEWQPRVLSWMRDAGLIIMYSGKTHWVNWELQKVLENECATRLILMIPEIKIWSRSERSEEISARVEQVRAVFKSTPWEEELSQFDDFAGLRAMLFRPDGRWLWSRADRAAAIPIT